MPKIGFLLFQSQFLLDKLVFLGEVNLFFNVAVQEFIDELVQLGFGGFDAFFKILSKSLRRLAIFLSPDINLRQHLFLPVFADSNF
ncbi:MAG: hypothetical protein U5L95_01160 [Candidatus Saccharibacteria bacterium]|nr:hypothetical protein [Candidatus Saccharibacteria bacterium]